NIIMDPNGEPKLADLGLAKFGSETNQECEELSATPMYAPPEVILRSPPGVGEAEMRKFCLMHRRWAMQKLQLAAARAEAG
ncbi:MAG: hypothetical protein RR060_04285, partial [Victivallaceae bacterium]